MVVKGRYLLGQNVSKEEFLPAFISAEIKLNSQTEPFGISDESYKMLDLVDINEVKLARMRNYSYLKSELSILGYKIVASGGINQVPIFCVIMLDDRDLVQKHLIDNHVYCPIHWPLYDELKEFHDSVLNQSKEISIPIDQRYTVQDMEFIVKCIRSYTNP